VAEDRHTPRRCLLDPWLLSVAIIWGGNFAAYKVVLETVPAMAIVGTRFGLLAPVLLLLARLLRRGAPVTREHLSCLLWAGVVIMGAQQVLFIKAMDMTSATEGALIITSAPIFTAIIAVIVGQEHLSRLNWSGVGVGFLGVGMVILGTRAEGAQEGLHLGGNLVMLASALLYGYFMVLAKDLVQRYGGLRTVAYCYGLASVLILPLATPDLLRTPWASLDLLTWLLLVGYIGLLAGVYGFTVWYTSIGRTTAATTAVYQYLVPVVALVSAAVFLGEQPRPAQVAGALVVLAGLGLTRWTVRPIAP